MQPKKVIDGQHRIIYQCPKCETILVSTKDGKISGNKSKFCSECGNSINWDNIKLDTFWIE